MSTSELSGSWRYRIFSPPFFNPTFAGTLTEKESNLFLADAVLKLKSSAQAGNLEGEYQFDGGILNLSGPFESGSEIFDYARFELVGKGPPNTRTDGWEYRYYGHLSWQWAKGEEVQIPTLVGSVIRVKAHASLDGRTTRDAGEVFSFIALKQEQPVGPGAWSLPRILEGSWNYRSFRNDPEPLNVSPTANGLILQEALFNLEIPTDTNLQEPMPVGSVRGGTIELPGGVLNIDLRRVRSAEVPPEFSFSGAGSGGDTSGWEYHYHGHLTRKWPNDASASGLVQQTPALVGSVAILRDPADRADRYKHLGPVGSVYPFIAVQKPPSP